MTFAKDPFWRENNLLPITDDVFCFFLVKVVLAKTLIRNALIANVIRVFAYNSINGYYFQDDVHVIK